MLGQIEPEKIQFDALNHAYTEYIEDLKRKWLSTNRMDSKDVYEVMRPEQQQEVKRRITEWSSYIAPLAEAWWKNHGFEVVWPEDNSHPMKVRKL